jgi:hypothetical protein
MNWSFFDTGVAFGVAALGAHIIVRFNVWLYRKIGFVSLARYWETQLHWWIPMVRVVCAAFAIIFMALGVGLV